MPSVSAKSIARIGVAIDADLIEKFDRHIERRGYTNRSEAFRDLIRDELIAEHSQAPSAPVVGTLTLVYDHHVRTLSEKLTGMQHEHHDSIVSTLHVHLDHDNCLEVLVLKGASGEVRSIADRLISTKGVRHGKLTITTTAPFSHSHPHPHTHA